jgi:hypothetical protein
MYAETMHLAPGYVQLPTGNMQEVRVQAAPGSPGTRQQDLWRWL